jgi:hypothetical protein
MATRMRWSLRIGMVLVVFALAASLGWFRWDTRRRAEGHAAYLCIANLRKIDTTKEAYAHEHGLKDGDLISTQALVELRAWPMACPAGGFYTINPVGKPPTCSVSGHAIPGL